MSQEQVNLLFWKCQECGQSHIGEDVRATHCIKCGVVAVIHKPKDFKIMNLGDSEKKKGEHDVGNEVEG